MMLCMGTPRYYASMSAGVAEVRINQEGRAHRDVCAIVVTYHPDREFPERLGLVLPQVGALIIVDNGSDDAEATMLRELAEHPSITLVLNRNNLGVASALNIGIRQAVARGFTSVLLLDQDSRVAANMLETLFEVYSAFPQRERLAVIGAGFVDVNRRASEEKAPPPADRRIAPADPDPWEEAETVITSGSLIPLASHAVIGPFREEFFIDYVDSDYCCRARAKGFSVIQTRRPLMSHAIGAWSKHRVLGLNKWTSNHSPDRRYYIARNDTVMLREYGNYVLGLWALKSILRRFRQCKRIAFYEDMKARKIIAVLQGWWDGVRGRMGPRVPLLGAAILCAFAVCSSNARAQSMEPRAYSNTPVGLNFLLAGYDYGKGETAFDPCVPITDAHLHTDTEVTGYSHTLGALGDSGDAAVNLPFRAGRY